jgi:hypothetical protein
VTDIKMKVHSVAATITSICLTLTERFGAFLMTRYTVRNLKNQRVANVIAIGMRTEFGSCHQMRFSTG